VSIEYPEASFPLGGVDRKFRHAITAGEGLSLVGQTSVPEVILDTVSAFRPFLDGSIFWGAYGPRVAGDLVNLVQLLDEDPHTRQAVLSIYDADRDLGRTKMADIPCTVAIQFRRRHQPAPTPFLEVLDMWVMMRSNDVWLGMPYDFGQFVMLQSAVADALGVAPGAYHHSAGSLHLYDKHHGVANALTMSLDVPRRIHPVFGGKRGGSGVERLGVISSRARRILIGQYDRLEDPSLFETWLNRVLYGG